MLIVVAQFAGSPHKVVFTCSKDDAHLTISRKIVDFQYSREERRLFRFFTRLHKLFHLGENGDTNVNPYLLIVRHLCILRDDEWWTAECGSGERG